MKETFTTLQGFSKNLTTYFKEHVRNQQINSDGIHLDNHRDKDIEIRYIQSSQDRTGGTGKNPDYRKFSYSFKDESCGIF